MRIQVLFFAQFKDLFGGESRVIEIKEGTTVGELAESLLSELKSDGLKMLPFRYAVNEEFKSRDTKLCSDDTLALIPPVSGG